MNHSDEQILTLWLGATRYYMGRQSYAVGEFCDLLIGNWKWLPENTRNLIRRDLEAEFERHERFMRKGLLQRPLGSDMDVRQWERVRALWQ